jgi:hypothetical protein
MIFDKNKKLLACKREGNVIFGNYYAKKERIDIALTIASEINEGLKSNNKEKVRICISKLENKFYGGEGFKI